MKFALKDLRDQVLVITGATSGIGLATARAAVSRGASVVLVARNEPALMEITEELQQQGGTATYAVADVADVEEVDQVARHALASFGRIDCWVNNAGVTIYGKVTDVSIEDARRLFDTNFWGAVNGSRVALEQLREGGSIINVGSTLSDRALPLQGMYSASKAALKGFTDALRMEVEHDRLPISITLIKPAAIDTPYLEHARNYLDVEPDFPPPVYDPQIVARAILRAAEHPVRELYAGGFARAVALSGTFAPRATDAVMKLSMFRGQRSEQPRLARGEDALYAPGEDGRERGHYRGRVLQRSLYTSMAIHPVRSALAIGLLLVAGALVTGAFVQARREG